EDPMTQTTLDCGESMLSSFMTDYAAPLVVAATVGAAGVFGINHAERITTLESQREQAKESQTDVTVKLDRISEIVFRIEERQKEQYRYEQRQDRRPRENARQADPLLQLPTG